MSECEGCKALRERVEKLCDKIDQMFAPVSVNVPAWVYDEFATADTLCTQCGQYYKSNQAHVCVTCVGTVP